MHLGKKHAQQKKKKEKRKKQDYISSRLEIKAENHQHYTSSNQMPSSS